MSLCPLWFWLLNSLIVGLMEEEIRFLVLFNTAGPLAPALVAGQWAVWLEAGRCRVTRRREQWAECLSQHYLPASLSLLLGSFFPSNKSCQPMAAFSCGGRIHTLILTHMHVHPQRKKEVSGGWKDCGEVKKTTTLQYCLCRCVLLYASTTKKSSFCYK